MVTFESLIKKQDNIAVIGLGYVGLPVALALAKKFTVIGIDVKKERIEELKSGIDKTGEVDTAALSSISEYTSDQAKIRNCRFIIIAVPTPVNEENLPDLAFVEKATSMVGKYLAPGSVVVYESTVYPGATEDICIPILEKESGLKAGSDFKVGYSPERINPGDKEHTLEKTIKVVSGMDAESLVVIAAVYGSITAVCRAASIKVAEAAKVIENTQRDLNVALMNELSVIFSLMDISIYEVLAVAGTKWNFLQFAPGLVGGHCIGIDPYYLTYKAQTLGYEPQVILSGRRMNDGMGEWIAGRILRRAQELCPLKPISTLKVLIAGITFKENISDVRNSKVFDIFKALQQSGIEPLVYDPVANPDDVEREYGIKLCNWSDVIGIDVAIIAVAHEQFKQMPAESWKKIFGSETPLVADIKHIFLAEELKKNNINYWSL